MRRRAGGRGREVRGRDRGRPEGPYERVGFG